MRGGAHEARVIHRLQEKPQQLGPGPLRVAVLTPSFGLGGGERVALDVAAWLRDSGICECYMYGAYSGGPMIEEARGRVAEAITLGDFEPVKRRIKRLLGETRVSGRDWYGPQDDSVAQAGRWRTMAFRTCANLLVLPRLVSEIRRRKIDLVHAHQESVALLGAIAGVVADVPVVVTIHDQEQAQETALERLSARTASRFVDEVVGVSVGSRDGFLALTGLPAIRGTVVYNGLSWKPDASRFSSDAPPTIGVAGSLITRKGHRVLLQAMAEIVSRIPTVRLLVAGDGPEMPTLQTMVQELGLAGRVSFLGAYSGLRDPKYLAFLKDIWCLAIPSFQEACPIVAIEAMAAAKPIVATQAGGLPEVVDDGVSGLLVRCGDPGALAWALVTLLTDKGLRDKYGRAGLERKSRMFSRDSVMAGYMDVYAHALGRPLVRNAADAASSDSVETVHRV